MGRSMLAIGLVGCSNSPGNINIIMMMMMMIMIIINNNNSNDNKQKANEKPKTLGNKLNISNNVFGFNYVW